MQPVRLLLAATLPTLTLLTLPGCDGDERTVFQILPSADRVVLDPLDEYREPGVYTRHLDDHGLYVVTIRPADESMLFALRRACPHDGDEVQHDSLSNRFHCPRGGHRFTVEGLPATPGYEGPGMVRVAVGEIDGKLAVLPERTFLFEKQQWSLDHAMLLLDPE